MASKQYQHKQYTSEDKQYNKQYIRAVAKALGVAENEPGIDQAVSMFRSLSFEPANLTGELPYNLRGVRGGEILINMGKAHTYASNWVDSTINYRIKPKGRKGRQVESKDYKVAIKAKRYLEDLLAKEGHPIR